jgi:hypothetical protein
MLIQQLNRTDAEKVQLVVKNVDGGGSITTGMGAVLVQTGASVDGVSAVRSTAALWKGFIGVANQDIAINGFGLVTAWGYANSVAISNVGSSITITAGDYLRPGAAAGTFFSGQAADQTLSTLLYRSVVAANSTPNALSAVADSYHAGFVRGL